MCNSEEVHLLKGVESKDHIHMHVEYPPSISISELVKRLKGRNSWLLQEEFPALRKRYWGRHLWASGYFCRSVGTVTRNIIKEYIENQEDEYDENFKIVE